MVEQGISVVTGTLNRRILLPLVIDNTVNADERLELVLVDGGSNDGTAEYIASLRHPRIRFIEVGGRSSYPDFMNLGVKNARHEIICQWNDDAVLVNPWKEVFSSLDDSAVYPFSWKEDAWPGFKDKKWVLVNSKKPDGTGEIVVNFGLYRKSVFRKIGLYNNAYHFYCADGDMAQRAWYFGFAIKPLPDIKVISLKKVAKTREYDLAKDWDCYQKHIVLYGKKILPDNLEYLP
jgi:glycosyltransferase involved in cell wall biosynthesis